MISWAIFGFGLVILILSALIGIDRTIKPILTKKRVKISSIQPVSVNSEWFKDPRLVPVSIAYSQYPPYLKEETARKKAAFWDKPSIDAILNALDIESTLREIKGSNTEPKLIGLMNMKPGELKSLYYDQPLPDQKPDKTRTDISSFFHSNNQGASQRPDLWVSTLAIHNALEIIMEITYYSGCYGNRATGDDKTRGKAKEEFGDWLKSCYNSILNNMYDDTGIILDMPWEQPQMSVNCAGWESLRKLDKVQEVTEIKNINWSKYYDWYNKHFRSGKDLRTQQDWIAFSDEVGGEPLVCATHHAISTAAKFPGEHKEHLIGNLNPFHIINFVNSCWTPLGVNSGGYSWTPEKEPTLIHTRYALGLIRSIMYLKPEITQEVFPIEPTKILYFIDSLWGPAGFSLVPKISPSLYASRAALLILKYLEILRIHNVFNADQEYFMLRDNLINKIDCTKDEMKKAYRSSKLNGYTCFPMELPMTSVS